MELNGSRKLTETIRSYSAFPIEQNPTPNPFTGPPLSMELLNSPKMDRTCAGSARAKYSDSGNKQRFIFPHCNDDWALDTPHPMQYDTALACFRWLAKLCGFGEKFTPRSTRDVLPTWAARVGWNKEGRHSLGRRPPNSEMPTWYDRAVRNTELRLRNEIIQKVQQ